MNVLAVDISTINQGGLAVEGIPLTEEWLLKFGFDENLELVIRESLSIEFNEDMQASLWAGLYIAGEADSLKIEYVHQLQNLYFALTGEDLEVK